MLQLESFMKTRQIRRYTSESIILYQGEIPRHACIVKSGVVRSSTISSGGDEQIIGFHRAGDIIPMSWLFGKTSSTLYFYQASTDVEVVMAERDELLAHIMRPEFAANLIDHLVTDQAASSIRISALEQPKAREKLMYTLYYLSKKYGIEKTKGSVHISLALTHQTLGALVGLTRETTATEMSKLKKQKVLTYKNQDYTVYIDTLLGLIGEDSFRDIKIT